MPILDKNGVPILDKRQQKALAMKRIAFALHGVVSELVSAGIAVPKIISLEFDENGRKMYLATDEESQAKVEKLLAEMKKKGEIEDAGVKPEEKPEAAAAASGDQSAEKRPKCSERGDLCDEHTAGMQKSEAPAA